MLACLLSCLVSDLIPVSCMARFPFLECSSRSSFHWWH